MTTNHTAAGGRTLVVQMLPVMLCFFAMGFVDLVGTASNYVQKDISLSHAQANLFPSLVFFWFLIFSVPTGMLMNRIGRKKTVLLSLVITLFSLVLPVFGSSYNIMLASFSLLGIGNAVMQTSLNPLVSNLIDGRRLASTLTLGQFVKAIASFLAPLLAGWGAAAVIPTFGLGWKVLFAVYAVVSVLSVCALAATPIHEQRPDRASGVRECVRLLGRRFVLLCFIAIMCHVGIDVGTNTTAPRIMMERLSMPLEEAGLATSVYFVFRTIGCFAGAILLRWISPRNFMFISVAMICAAMGLLMAGHTQAALYSGLALAGLGNSNVFSIVFAQALLHNPAERNEVSGLMIMGLFGGTVFPLAMGYAADAAGQAAGVAVMALGAVYLLFYSFNIKTIK